jgi:hypothetical protein
VVGVNRHHQLDPAPRGRGEFSGVPVLTQE